MRTISITVLLLFAAVVLQAQEPPAAGVRQFKLFTEGTFGFVSEQLFGGPPVKGAPYSAEAVTETTQILADGNRIGQKSTSMLYRDSLGRERREEALPMIGSFAPQADSSRIISISDPVAGVNYSLNPKEHVAIKLPSMPGPPPASGTGKFNIMIRKSEIGPPSGAGPVVFYRANENAQPTAKIEQLGWKVIEGVQAEGTRSTTTIAAGQIGNERPIDIMDEQWRSPDLQMILWSKHTDPRFGETVYSLTNISRADPAPGLFQVPSDYTITDRKPIIPAR